MLRRSSLAVVLVIAALPMLPRAAVPQPTPFARFAEQFVYDSVALSPAQATFVGYHRHNGTVLDEQLDDLSPGGIQRQREFYLRVRDQLQHEVRREELSSEEQADFGIIEDQVALALLELDTIQSYRHNPTVYVELVGNALFGPHVLEYAARPERVRHIIARLRLVPGLLAQARVNLADLPPIWTRVAMDENDGNIGLIEKTLPPTVPADLKAQYDAAASPALAALKEFRGYLEQHANGGNADWRLGPERYAQKFRYVIATDLSVDQVLARAEADVQAVRARMLELALPLHRQWFPDREGHATLPPGEREQRVVAETLARIADRHTTREHYIEDARRDLDEARAFVRSSGLLTLPPRDNLQVIETPEFMRGIYAVGGFAAAPALEPRLGAFYWITPIPATWPEARIESKLREYNFYKLKLLTIHEAMPGHYVQQEIANDVQPQYRRVLRGVFGNSPYVEGWGQYSTQATLEAGFLGNPPELRLTFQKEELRVLANAILDIRLHTRGMTDEQALQLMERTTFQEREEATAKLQRAKLSSCQLPTYSVGWRDWLRVREAWTAANPGKPLKAFHDGALAEGAVPLPTLARLLTGHALAAGH